MGWPIDQTKPLWHKFISKCLMNIASRKAWAVGLATWLRLKDQMIEAWQWFVIVGVWIGYQASSDLIEKAQNGKKNNGNGQQ